MLGSLDNNGSPVQLYHLASGDHRCEVKPPASALKDRVHYYWRLSIEAPLVNLQIVPDMAVDLVIAPESDDFSVLYFPSAEPWQLALEGPVVYFGICLPLTAAPALFSQTQASLRSLTPGRDTTIGLGISELYSQVHTDTVVDDFAAACDSLLTGLVTEPRSSIRQETLNLEALLGDLETDLVGPIAARWGISERQLRRLSVNMTGMSPKKLQNTLRLQATLLDLLGGRESSSDGFYDDAHRIHSLKRLTGLTPGEIQRLAAAWQATLNKTPT